MNAPAPANAKTAAVAPINLAAAENLNPEVFATLSKLGVSIVIVFFGDVKEGHPATNRGPIQDKLGRDLEGASAGEYHSTFLHPTQRWFIYHVWDCGKGIAALKAGLGKRGLLEYARIFTVEADGALLTWYPATAERIPFAP